MLTGVFFGFQTSVFYFRRQIFTEGPRGWQKRGVVLLGSIPLWSDVDSPQKA
jgi:hypothetical protein